MYSCIWVICVCCRCVCIVPQTLNKSNANGIFSNKQACLRCNSNTLNILQLNCIQTFSPTHEHQHTHTIMPIYISISGGTARIWCRSQHLRKVLRCAVTHKTNPHWTKTNWITLIQMAAFAQNTPMYSNSGKVRKRNSRGKGQLCSALQRCLDLVAYWCTNTRTHTHAHTHTYTQIHTYIHTRSLSKRYRQTDTRKHAHTHTHVYAISNATLS